MIPASSVSGALCTARHSRAAQRRRRHAERKPRFVASAETAANYDIPSMSLSGRQLGGRTSGRTGEWVLGWLRQAAAASRANQTRQKERWQLQQSQTHRIRPASNKYRIVLPHYLVQRRSNTTADRLDARASYSQYYTRLDIKEHLQKIIGL